MHIGRFLDKDLDGLVEAEDVNNFFKLYYQFVMNKLQNSDKGLRYIEQKTEGIFKRFFVGLDNKGGNKMSIAQFFEIKMN